MYGLLSSKQAAGDGKARRAAIGNLCSDLTPLHAPSDSSNSRRVVLTPPSLRPLCDLVNPTPLPQAHVISLAWRVDMS